MSGTMTALPFPSQNRTGRYGVFGMITSMGNHITPPFKLPTKLSGMTDIAYSALQLAALSSRLALEERTLVNHITGRAENVAEHSHMLAIVAPGIAELYYPHLDANLISRFASIHDAVEAYVGDTTTHDIDSQGLRQKAPGSFTSKERFRFASHRSGADRTIRSTRATRSSLCAGYR